MQEELSSCFSPSCTLQVRPGADNFFRGVASTPPAPGAERTMLASARAFYSAWVLGGAEAALTPIAAPKLRMFDPVWEEAGAFLPVNRVEAAMWLERKVKQCGGELRIEPKAIAVARGTNMVRYVARNPFLGAVPAEARRALFCRISRFDRLRGS